MYKCHCVDNVSTSVCLPVYLSGFSHFLPLSQAHKVKAGAHTVGHIDGQETTVHTYVYLCKHFVLLFVGPSFIP